MTDKPKQRSVVKGGIPGLTERPPELRSLGKLRKGEEKEEKRPGRELPYFRAVFNDGEDLAEADFIKAYGDEPKRIKILFPFASAERIWEAYFESWKGGVLIVRAALNSDIGDEVYYMTKREPDSKKYMVKNWKDVDTGESVEFNLNENIHPVSGDPCGPVVWSYKKKNSDEIVEVFATPIGRLRVIVAELIGYVGTMTVITTSIVDIGTITQRLAWLQEWADEANEGNLFGIPCLLMRVEGTAPLPGGGRKKVWYIDVGTQEDIATAITQKMIGRVYSGLALPEPVIEVDEAVGIEEADDIQEGEFRQADEIPDVTYNIDGMESRFALPILEIVIKKGFAANHQEAIQILNQSKALPANANSADCVRWAEGFIKRRDEKEYPIAKAVQLTDQAYKKWVKK